VARLRGLSLAVVQQRIAAQSEGRLFGFIGEPRVNVLRLNLALDAEPAPAR
jgi:K+-transporting ATPase ATPase C chain